MKAATTKATGGMKATATMETAAATVETAAAMETTPAAVETTAATAAQRAGAQRLCALGQTRTRPPRPSTSVLLSKADM
jgi:hypothetical protein